MASIRSADTKPPPTLLPTPLPVTINPVQPLLETMDMLPTLHPDLQWVVDKQQPMSIDVLPALHPDLQWVVDKQQPMSIDVPPALHPSLQRIIDEQQPMSMEV
jgi:hypothetical protein